MSDENEDLSRMINGMVHGRRDEQKQCSQEVTPPKKIEIRDEMHTLQFCLPDIKKRSFLTSCVLIFLEGW